MFKLLFDIPAVILSFFWSLCFPPRHRPAPALPPAPDPNAPSEESQQEGHEVSDASATLVGLYVVGLFMVIFIAMGALGWMYIRLYAKGDAMPVRAAQESFKHGPGARTSIAKDWTTLDAQVHQHLDSYGWSDRAHGVVHVPIARAMGLVAAEGLPARAAQPPAFPPPDQEKLPLMQLESTDDATKFDPHQ